MKKKEIFAGIALLVLGLSLVGFGGSQAQAATKVIKVGATGTSFPTAYKKNGKLVGFDVEVFNAAAKKAGYKVQWVTGDFDGLLTQLDNGSLDTVANDVAITPERAKKYDFSSIYNKEETTVAVDKSSTINNLKELGSKTIAAAGASNNTANLKNFDQSVKFKMFDARDETYEALLAGHVDGVVNTRNNLSALITAKKYSWKILKGSAATVNIALPFAQNSTGTAERTKINKALKQLKQDGTLKKLSEKYFGYDAVKSIK